MVPDTVIPETRHANINVLLNRLFCAICLNYILTRALALIYLVQQNMLTVTILWVFTDIYIFHI